LIEWNNVFLTGKADDIITEENMRNTYGIEIKVVKNKFSETTVSSCIPLIKKQ